VLHTTRTALVRFTVPATFVALSLLALAGCGEKKAEALRFSAIPDQNSTELAEKFAPLAAHLTEALGMPVEYVPARDYQATVEMFRNDDIQLAWFGGLTGVQARESVPGARAIAQGEADPRYFSYFIGNWSLDEGQHTRFPGYIGKYPFCFGSESSTSGRLMPEYFIRKFMGMSVLDFFEQGIFFSGSHDKTIELVEAGQFKAGVVNYKVYDQRIKEGKTDPEKCRILWKTPTYSDYNWTAHPSLDERYGEGFVDKLQSALIAIDDPGLLAALPREKLIAASNEEYEGIREVALELGMLR